MRTVIWFSFPPHNKNAVLKDSLNDAAYDGYMAFLTENVHAKLISDVRGHIYEGKYFEMFESQSKKYIGEDYE